MEIAFGLGSVRLMRHSSYDDLKSHIEGECGFVLLGGDGDAFVSFWSIDISRNPPLNPLRVGVISESDYSLPHVAVPPTANYLAVGFNRHVAFIDTSTATCNIMTLEWSFSCFYAFGNRLVAIHGLGCQCFDVASASCTWVVTTDVVVNYYAVGGFLYIDSEDGVRRIIDILSGDIQLARAETDCVE